MQVRVELLNSSEKREREWERKTTKKNKQQQQKKTKVTFLNLQILFFFLIKNEINKGTTLWNIYISKVKWFILGQVKIKQKNTCSSSKTKCILAIHFALNYRLVLSSRNKLESTEMKENRCLFKRETSPRQISKEIMNMMGMKCTTSKYLHDSPCWQSSHRGQAVIENVFLGRTIKWHLISLGMGLIPAGSPKCHLQEPASAMTNKMPH